MQQRDQHRESPPRRTAGRLAATALAAGALSAALAIMAPGIAGAQGSTTTSTISTIKDGKLGTILVAGDTPVYTLKGKKACDATCMTQRPPVLLPQGVTTPTAGTGVDASKLGTTTANGGTQITYAGKPLYWSSKDTGSGKPRGVGSDKFGKWALVVTKAGSSSSGGGGGSNPGSGGVSF